MMTSIVRAQTFYTTMLYRTYLLPRCLFSTQATDISREEYLHNEPKENKILKVAIIGAPNAGKSTLINKLVRRRICCTSSKVHTTRKYVRAVGIEGSTQLIFLDTPGLVTGEEMRKFNLDRNFLSDTETAMLQADVIGVVHDVSNKWKFKELDTQTLRLLQLHSAKPSFLILNKIDVLKTKQKLLEVVDALTNRNVKSVKENTNTHVTELSVKNDIKTRKGWSDFSEVFMVSALIGSGMNELKGYLLDLAKPGHWLFKPDKFTDASSDDIILQTVKSRLLENLPQEIPYSLKPKMEFFEIKEDGYMVAVVLVNCPSQRLTKLVIGPGGRRIKRIAQEAEQDLRDTFHGGVHLKVVVSEKT